jgi:hypothetical protein
VAAEFVAYIDEAGDEGFKFQPGEKGSSRWFVLSAAVVRKTNDLLVVKVAREVRQVLGKPDKYVLHFRELKHEQRIPFARLISAAPIRTVHVMVHKPSIKNPENFQREAHKLYRYLTRLLLERVSWLCRDNSRDGDGSVDLVFSNRAAMSYDELKEYMGVLLRQAANGGDVNIDWGVVSSNRLRAVNHDQLAGLQIADAVATSAFYAVNKSQYGEVEERYLRLIRNSLYRNNGRLDGYGIKVWCDDDGAEKNRLAAIASLRN